MLDSDRCLPNITPRPDREKCGTDLGLIGIPTSITAEHNSSFHQPFLQTPNRGCFMIGAAARAIATDLTIDAICLMRPCE